MARVREWSRALTFHRQMFLHQLGVLLSGQQERKSSNQKADLDHMVAVLRCIKASLVHLPQRNLREADTFIPTSDAHIDRLLNE